MRIKTWLAGIGLFYAASLAMPAFGDPATHCTRGWYCLLMVPYVMSYPAWWANPLLLTGAICLARRKILAAWSIGLLASVLAVSFGVTVAPITLHIGYYTWTACMVGLTAAAFDHRYSGLMAAGAAHDSASTSGEAEGSSSASSSSVPLSSRSPS